MIATAESAVDLKLCELLEEFMSLLRKGQGVPVREFAKRYPEYSARITADFPALLMAEGIKPRVSTAPGPAASDSLQEAPELLAGYRVIRQIGQGGMGVVYEAEHPRLSRRLAVKVLLGRKRNPNLTDSFRREAEAASRLSHPNIVPVFDFGEHNGVPYMAMPLIEGLSLEQLLERYRSSNRSSVETRPSAGRLKMVTNPPRTLSPGSPPTSPNESTNLIGPEADFKKLATLGAEVAAALAHAHDNNTIHRDIKPGNLILDEDGKIWITDFGLAKVRDEDRDLSHTGDVIGAPRFMAPEQMRGHCDARSDIYSLGLTLYEMASGVRVWDSLSTAQLMKVRQSAELPELADHAPFVPKPLAEIIMKACSGRPEDRYQSAHELQVVLNRFAHGQKTEDRRRRPRAGTSVLDRRGIIVSCSISVPALTFGVMYALSLGPWSPARLTTPEALISLVEDQTQREKIVRQLPLITEAAITSKDAKVRERAADLTMPALAEAMKKPEVSNSEKAEITKRIGEVTEEDKMTGFVYDKMNHPLTNAIRNLDLADQISKLTLSPQDKRTAQAKLATIGESIRGRFLTDIQIANLIELLPVEAQKGPTTTMVLPPQLIRFIMLLNSTFEEARARLTANQQLLQRKLLLEAKEHRQQDPVTGGTIKLPRGPSIPSGKDQKIPTPQM